MKHLYRNLLAAFLVACTGTAQASLVALGDFTTDTNTSLDWLDLDLTMGLSLNQVVAQTSSGGTFDGWQSRSAACSSPRSTEHSMDRSMEHSMEHSTEHSMQRSMERLMERLMEHSMAGRVD